MKKHRAERKAAFIKKYDTNGDGKLCKQEKKAAHEAIAAKRKEIHQAVLKKFDKNGDGKLCPVERKGVHKWIKKNYPEAATLGYHHHHQKPQCCPKKDSAPKKCPHKG